MSVKDKSTPDEVIRGRVRVEWQGIGEGLSGDYDENDPDDVELLRFYTSVNTAQDGAEPEWTDIQDGSYCTLFPEDTTPEQRQAALELIMGRVFDRFHFAEPMEGDSPGFYAGSPDKELEIMSYIEPAWLETGVPESIENLSRDSD